MERNTLHGEVYSGVLQGSVLEPLLFMEALSAANNTERHTGYTDGTQVVEAVKEPSDDNHLSNDTDVTYKWA